jgi:hypothetical protein
MRCGLKSWRWLLLNGTNLILNIVRNKTLKLRLVIKRLVIKSQIRSDYDK